MEETNMKETVQEEPVPVRAVDLAKKGFRDLRDKRIEFPAQLQRLFIQCALPFHETRDPQRAGDHHLFPEVGRLLVSETLTERFQRHFLEDLRKDCGIGDRRFWTRHSPSVQPRVSGTGKGIDRLGRQFP